MLNLDIETLRQLNQALQEKLTQEHLIVQGMLPQTGLTDFDLQLIEAAMHADQRNPVSAISFQKDLIPTQTNVNSNTCIPISVKDKDYEAN